MDDPEVIAKLGDVAAEAGLRQVSMLAWRDLDDPEAGGSELSAAMVAKYWAEAGIEVTMRTSFAAGKAQVAWRDGYKVIRKAGRYLVFPRAAFSEMMGWHNGRDGLVEIWNGVPFFSPIWARTPRVTWLHHVHAEMWQMTLPPKMAAFGNFVESRVAPPFYKRTSIVTPSESSKQEIVEALKLRADHITVVPPGVDVEFTPFGPKSPVPLVVSVGRLVPVKRFDVLIDALVALKPTHPQLQAVIAGEGYCRPDLEAQIRNANAEDWISLPGRVTEEEKLDLYRRAWLLAMTSSREGFGMIITEAGACGTPAVASRVVGFVDSIVEGTTGLLGDGVDGLSRAIASVLDDPALRERLSLGALEYARRFTWGATALGILEPLAADAIARRQHGGS